MLKVKNKQKIPARQKISKYLEDLDNTITQQNLSDLSIERSSKQNVNISLSTMEYSSIQTIAWAIKETSTNVKELQLYRGYSLTYYSCFNHNSPHWKQTRYLLMDKCLIGTSIPWNNYPGKME